MGSIAGKLRSLRISSELTLEQAAKMAGFRNFQTLSKIEKGTRSVKAEELVSLAKAYSFDINLFLLDEPKPRNMRIFLRADPNPPKDKSVHAKFTMYFERYLHLIKTLDLSTNTLNLPVQPIGDMNLKNADSLGDTYTGLLKLGDRPALSLSSILENEYNLPIFYLPLPEGVSAISLIADDKAAICVNQNDALWRQRFDIAHELFHILHKQSISAKCGEDETSLSEKCANAFAAALLLPKNALDKEIDVRRKKEQIGIAALISIACDFGVSLSALIWRLVNIRRLKKHLAMKILDSESTKEYDKNFRKKESRDTPHISHKYICMVFEAVNQGSMSQIRAAEYLEIPVSKLEEMFLNAGLILREEPDFAFTLV